jgi:lipopolysaccharide export system permease protein
MRRLDRYIFLEVLGPLGLGFLVYTFILLLQFLFRAAEMIIRRGLPAATVGKLLIYTLPNILVLTIPMALLFGVLVAIGRLASDSELVALRSCGISLYRLYRPVLILSAALTAVNLFFMLVALPWGNTSLQGLRSAILSQTAAEEVRPRVFSEDFQGKVVYAFDTPLRGSGWRGVFLGDSIPTAKNEVTVADQGDLRLDSATQRVTLRLDNAVTHKVDLDNAERYEVSRSRTMDQVLVDRLSEDPQQKTTSSKGMRERTLAELRVIARDPTRIPDLAGLAGDHAALMLQRRNAEVEIHKKFAIPAACVVFAFCALPLAFNNRRGGKSSGFALSLAVILAYYVMLTLGEKGALAGTLPAWLGMWGPNLVLVALGAVLAVRRNRDRRWGFSRWIPRLPRRRRATEAPAPTIAPHPGRRFRLGVGTPDLVLRLPRLRLVFPNTLDRYVMRSFLWIFALVAASCIAIFIIGDLTDTVAEMFKNHVAGQVVFDYYKYRSLQIFFDLAPIAVLITSLVVFSLLSRTNEVTACKALGVSLYRLCIPALVAASLVSLLCVFLQAQVLPASNQRVAQLNDKIKGRETARTYRRADRQWLAGQGRYLYNYLHYDEKAQTLQRLQVFEFDESYRLVRRLYASTARYVGSRWVFTDSWQRTFDGAQVTGYQKFPQPILVDYPETPDYFESEIKRPEQMTYGELSDYVGELQRSGQSVPELEVDLHSKLAFPVVSFVMGMVALPFAFRIGKRGALYGLGMAVVLGIVFLGIFAFFKTMGEAGALPPLVAVWSPSLLFALFSGYLFLGVRT